jgi:ethanolamine utilization protein EutN
VIIALVLGNVVATEKDRHYKGKKVLIVQPLGPDGKPKGKSFLAVDGVQAGAGDRVLVVDEGGSARLAVQDEAAVTIRAAVCGIVDRVDIEDTADGPEAAEKPAADAPRRGK